MDAIIVGAGLSGLSQLYSLRRRGYECKAIEKGSGLGGVWHWTSYPGARLDTGTPAYEFSNPDLYKDWSWSCKYADVFEIRRYLEYVDSKLDLSRDVILNTVVISATFDANANQWTVKTSTGETYRCTYFISATGLSSKPYIPSFRGIDSFKGTLHHTARYPRDGIDLRGKRLCVVGTGASGVQIVQEVAPIVKHLTVLQRTPNTAFPMRNEPLDQEEMARAKRNGEYAAEMARRRGTFCGLDYDFIQRSALDDPPKKRRELLERSWAKGGFEFWIGYYYDTVFNMDSNDTLYEFWAEKTRARINDPRKKDILAPETPYKRHALGARRPSLEHDYYEMFNRENVEVFDVKNNPIDEFNETGIKLRDGESLEFDVILLATGFDAVTGELLAIDIRGPEQTLREKWANGTAAYLGLGVSGFPNMFFILGPQAPGATSNAPTLAESQSEWVADAIDFCKANGKKTIEPRADAEQEYYDRANALLHATLFTKAGGWMCGGNIPGKKVEALTYLGGMPAYLKEIEDEADRQYAGWTLDAARSA